MSSNPGGTVPEPSAAQPVPSTGRAFLVYTAWRLVLFVGAFVLLVAVGLRGLLALGAAVLLSAVASIFLLREQRDALARAAAARSARQRAERDQLRSRLDD